MGNVLNKGNQRVGQAAGFRISFLAQVAYIFIFIGFERLRSLTDRLIGHIASNKIPNKGINLYSICSVNFCKALKHCSNFSYYFSLMLHVHICRDVS